MIFKLSDLKQNQHLTQEQWIQLSQEISGTHDCNAKNDSENKICNVRIKQRYESVNSSNKVDGPLIAFTIPFQDFETKNSR